MAKTTVKTKAKLLRGLTFEIQELPRSSKEDLSTPLNVKVKYKSKHPELFENNVICLPKIENAPCEEVRVVRSDQTLMSFKMLMENEIRATKTSSKSRRIFTKCLGIHYDGNDSFSYLPSAAIESKHVVSSVTEEMQKRKKKKYKPGGCLDPVMSDDNNYAYKPKAPRKSLNLKIIDSLLVGKATDSPKESKDLDFVKQNENKNNSILSIFKAEPDKLLLDSKYSNTIITYPPEATSSSQLIKDGLQNKFRRASSQLQQQIQMHQSKQGFFVPTDVSKHENLDTFDRHDFVRTLKEQAKRKSDDTTQLLISKKEPDKPNGSHEEDVKYKSILRSGISPNDQSIDNENHHQPQTTEQNLNNVVIGIIPITENEKETLSKNPRQPLKPDSIENEEKKGMLDKIEILNNDNLINSQDEQSDVKIKQPRLMANNDFNGMASNLLIKDDVLRTVNDDTSKHSDKYNGKNIIETSSKSKLSNDDSAIFIQGIPNDKNEPQDKQLKQNEEIKYQRTSQHLYDNEELITENNLGLLAVPKTATKDLREHNMISSTAATIYDKRNNVTFVPLITAKESENLINDKQNKIQFDQIKSENMELNLAKETQIVEDQSQNFDSLKENFNIPLSDAGINNIKNCENDKNYAREVEKQNKNVLEKTPSDIKLDKQKSELTKHQSLSKPTSIMNTPESLSQTHTNRQNQLVDRKSIDKPSNKQMTSTERESMNSHVVLIKPQELTIEQTNFEGEEKRKLSFLKRNDSSFLDRDDEDKDDNDDLLLIHNQKSSSRDKIIFSSKVPKSIQNSGQGESKELFRESTNTNGDKTGNVIENGGTSSNTLSSLPHAIKMKSYEKYEIISIGSIKTNSIHNLPEENEHFGTKSSYRDTIISGSKVSKPNENSEQEENNSISSEQFREITNRNDDKIGSVVKNGGTSSNIVSSLPYAIKMKSYEKYETISIGSIKSNSIDNMSEENVHFDTKSSYRDKTTSGCKVSKPNKKTGQEESTSISSEQFYDITNADEDKINNGIQNEHFGTKSAYRNRITSGSKVSKPNKKSGPEESNSISSEQFRDITNADEDKINNGIQNEHFGTKSSYRYRNTSGSKVSKPKKKSGPEESNPISSEQFRDITNANEDKINNGIQSSRLSSNTLHQNSSPGGYKMKSYENCDVTSTGSIKTNSIHNLPKENEHFGTKYSSRDKMISSSSFLDRDDEYKDVNDDSLLINNQKSSSRDKIIFSSKVPNSIQNSGQGESKEQFREITNRNGDEIGNVVKNGGSSSNTVSSLPCAIKMKSYEKYETISIGSIKTNSIDNLPEENVNFGTKSSYRDKITSGSKVSKPNENSGQENNSISSEQFREITNADNDKIDNGIQSSRLGSNTLNQNSSPGPYKIKSYEKSDVTSTGSIKTNSIHNLHQYIYFSDSEIKTVTPLKIHDTLNTVNKERSVNTDAVYSSPKIFETESYESYEVKTVPSMDSDVIHSSPVIYETESYETYEVNPLKQVRSNSVHDSPNIVVSNIRYKVKPESNVIYDSETSKMGSQMESQTSKYMYGFDRVSNEPMKNVSSSKFNASSEEKDKVPEFQDQVARMEQIYISSSKQNLEDKKDNFISYRKDTLDSMINQEIKYILSDTKLTHNVRDDLDELQTSDTMDNESNPYVSDRTRASLVQHYDEKIKSPSNLDDSKSIISQVTTNNLQIFSPENFKNVETTNFKTSLKESRESKLQEYQNDEKSKYEEKSEGFLYKDIQDDLHDAQSPYKPNLTALQPENIDNLQNREPTYEHIKTLDNKNNIDHSGATYGKQISKTNDSILLSHDSAIQISGKEPHENDNISKNNIEPYDFNASHTLILENKQSEKSQKPNMEPKAIHKRISRSVSADSLPMKLDLAFESYVNKNNKSIIIKSVDSHIKSQNAIYVNTAVHYSKEIKIDIDKINNMSIKIQQKHEVAKGYGTDDVHEYKKDWKKINPQISGVGGKLQKTLSSIYKREIVPLKDTIKNLREEIDQLASLQESIRSKLYGKKSMKVKRVIPVNKNCVCVKFEDNKICKKN